MFYRPFIEEQLMAMHVLQYIHYPLLSLFTRHLLEIIKYLHIFRRAQELYGLLQEVRVPISKKHLGAIPEVYPPTLN